MDTHRIRFIEHEPTAIHSVAFSDAATHPKLAVARKDANIEIWITNDGECYYQDVFIPGRSDTSAESLVWCGKRLFSAGLKGHIHEWDMLLLRPKVSLDSLGGAVWCLDANTQGSMLAAGCEDGQLLLLEVTSDGFQLARKLDQQGGRILSLAWHPDGGFIAMGGADSTIRKMDVLSGRCVLRITLDEFKARSTLVWAVRFLGNSTIISGDSLGKIQMWNGQYGTLKQSLQIHKADVLTIAVNKAEDAIYASGVDHKILRLRKVKSKGNKWVKAGEVRSHTHDVRSLALSETGLLASGGVDTRLILSPVDPFEIRSAVTYPSFSGSARHFAVAPDANVLLYQGSTTLKLWQIYPQPPTHTEDGSTSPGKSSNRGLTNSSEVSNSFAPKLPVNFLDIKSKGPLHILSSAISHNGTLLAFSNTEQMWLYRIRVHAKAPKAECLKNEALPSYKMAFVPSSDSQQLVLATIDSGLNIAELSFDSGCQMELKLLETKKDSSKSHSITDFQISRDGKFLATCNSRKGISLYTLESRQLLARLPRFEAQPLCFTFHPSRPSLVLFSGPEKEVFAYNIVEESLLCLGSLHFEYKFRGRSKLASPTAIVPLPSQENLFAVYDNDCLVFIRLDNKTKSVSPGQKRKGGDHVAWQAVPYEVLLFASPLAGGEVVAVERTWTDVVRKLPPVLLRDKYGT